MKYNRAPLQLEEVHVFVLVEIITHVRCVIMIVLQCVKVNRKKCGCYFQLTKSFGRNNETFIVEELFIVGLATGFPCTCLKK